MGRLFMLGLMLLVFGPVAAGEEEAISITPTLNARL
jgi:hypothetical protein